VSNHTQNFSNFVKTSDTNNENKMQEIQEKLLAVSEGKIESKDEIYSILNNFLDLLEEGTIRSAEKINGNWQANTWVKQGILQVFKNSPITEMNLSDNYKFFDKDLLPLKKFDLNSGVRIVPGGSGIRRGAFLAKGVICMPPMYVNIGAFVDEGTMIDSHALVGTCAQIGKRVHLSAAAQVGGVLEPAGAKPVIIEDDVLVGGNCGIYEGVQVKRRAVLASGVILTASTKVFDLVNETVITSSSESPLVIPEGAVLVSGSRSLTSQFAKDNGLNIYSPLIIKYRVEKTDSKTALEEALR
jgi:2,3,4,5-tetrahydropyridine-2-carboxylate N-succinyltransferase